MPMSEAQPMSSRQEITTSLIKRAAELWGNERAKEIGPAIEEATENIWQISHDLPSTHEEPGFYF